MARRRTFILRPSTPRVMSARGMPSIHEEIWPTYILTYDIPNEHRERFEDALTDILKAKRELGVSTFWRASFKSLERLGAS